MIGQIRSPLSDYFPSSQPFAIKELVAKILEAAVRLQVVPMDTAAMQTLVEVEAEAAQWCESLAKPGKFTGAPFGRPMSMKDLNSGHQAWAKKVPPWLAIITHSSAMAQMGRDGRERIIGIGWLGKGGCIKPLT